MIDPAPHLLIVDDDERIRALLTKFLLKQGFLVSKARDAVQARALLSGLEFDLLILDVMMPGENGIALTRSLRETLMTPIILLTAKAESNDRIEGLEAGADDYLPKPFEPKELVLRINAILRRMPSSKDAVLGPTMIQMGEIHFDAGRSELFHGDSFIRLTATEVQLMKIFCAHLNEPITRTRLVQELGRDESQAQERAVDVQITRLRRKIEADPKQPRYLQTVRGEGYMLVPD